MRAFATLLWAWVLIPFALSAPSDGGTCGTRLTYVIGDPIARELVEDSFVAAGRGATACATRPVEVAGHSVVSVGVSRCGRAKLSDVLRGLDWMLHSHGDTPGAVVMPDALRGHPLVEAKLARLASRLDVRPAAVPDVRPDVRPAAGLDGRAWLPAAVLAATVVACVLAKRRPNATRPRAGCMYGATTPFVFDAHYMSKRRSYPGADRARRSFEPHMTPGLSIHVHSYSPGAGSLRVPDGRRVPGELF